MCVEFILCKERSIYVIEYNIVNDTCELTLKQSFSFGDEHDVRYKRSACGMCVFRSMSQYKSDNEFKSNDNISNGINSDGQAYDIILFGNGNFDIGHGTFVSSLEWLSLKISNDKSYTMLVDHEKTRQFQNTFGDKDLNYRNFGYTKWKHYLILCGGMADNAGAIDSIFYFDFFEMKWYKSFQVL